VKDRHPRVAPQNLLDKAIAYFSPKVAQRRMQTRVQLALSGGYTGARMDRASMAAWRLQPDSPDSAVIADLPELRKRSADLERNAPIATGIIGTTCMHVVGTGLSCNPQVDAEFLGLTQEQADEWQLDTRRKYKAWAESKDCDLSRTLNIYGLQELALRSVLSRGDVFALTPRVARESGPERLALQLIEADLVCNPNTTQNTLTLTDGIEHSTTTGEAIAVHVANHHPGDMMLGGTRAWTRVPVRGDNTGRRAVLHLYRQLRPGLRRGVPILAPVIEPLKQLARYTEAELHAAVVSGLFAMFIQMDSAAFDTLFTDDDSRGEFLRRGMKWSGELESGKAVNLLPGETANAPNPGRPNAQFDPFVSSCVRQIGMAIGIPYEVLIMHYQSSYSAARGALLMAWRFFMGWRDWLATNFCQPVYELWLSDEISEGRISALGYFADDVTRHSWSQAQWVGDGPGSIDPDKEVSAAAARVALGTSTLQAESILHDGVDWETKHRQQVKEGMARKEAGMMMPGEKPAPPAPAPGAKPGAPAEDKPNPEGN
jgi:lambda family phage portal protein